SAAPQTSGRMTMPAPPPNGVSSTVRCRSVAQLRRSWTARASSPEVTALPTSESRSGARYSGKIETTSIRTSGVALGRLVDVVGLRALGQRDLEVCRVAGQESSGRVEHDPAALDVHHRDERPGERDERPGAVRL